MDDARVAVSLASHARVGGTALFGGSVVRPPSLARSATPSGPLSGEAKALLQRAWKGLDPERVLDSTCMWRRATEPRHRLLPDQAHDHRHDPLDYLKFTIYEPASGVTQTIRCDLQYMDALTGYWSSRLRTGARCCSRSTRCTAPKACRASRRASSSHRTSTCCRWRTKHPDHFAAGFGAPVPADAVEALEKAVEGGAVAVKWLPNAMNIDPATEAATRSTTRS